MGLSNGGFAGIIVAICIVVVGIAVLTAYLATRRKKGETPKESKEEKLTKEMDRFEKSNFKKCRNCGANVPTDHNICLECGQQP